MCRGPFPLSPSDDQLVDGLLTSENCRDRKELLGYRLGLGTDVYLAIVHAGLSRVQDSYEGSTSGTSSLNFVNLMCC